MQHLATRNSPSFARFVALGRGSLSRWIEIDPYPAETRGRRKKKRRDDARRKGKEGTVKIKDPRASRCSQFCGLRPRFSGRRSYLFLRVGSRCLRLATPVPIPVPIPATIHPPGRGSNAGVSLITFENLHFAIYRSTPAIAFAWS